MPLSQPNSQRTLRKRLWLSHTQCGPTEVHLVPDTCGKNTMADSSEQSGRSRRVDINVNYGETLESGG
jgi:hypothetical protein